ncbi:hypothetical protein L7F22_050002 [Adiantum nelumboides]|nr:hypothetical protein [Adiantum nelumboides]
MVANTAATSLAFSFLGTQELSNGIKSMVVRFGGKKGPKQALKKSSSASSKDQPLWYLGCKLSTWLDGTLVGDYGFNPLSLSLSKPAEYLQHNFDSLN